LGRSFSTPQGDANLIIIINIFYLMNEYGPKKMMQELIKIMLKVKFNYAQPTDRFGGMGVPGSGSSLLH
jgi:hypothetical protein